jgi:hypothetical protein
MVTPQKDTLGINARRLLVDDIDVLERLRSLEARIAQLEADQLAAGSRSDLVAATATLAAKIAALEGRG